MKDGPQPIASTEAVARLRRAAALIAADRGALERTAARFSICGADAEDACQRAIEILIAKGPDLPCGQLLAWAQVVTRNEALAVRRHRTRLLGAWRRDQAARPVSLEPDQLAGTAVGPEDAIEMRERIAEAAERLRALKPAERRAVGLQAAGCSYEEIQAITGWTYTKVNRCLTEGRARLRERALG